MTVSTRQERPRAPDARHPLQPDAKVSAATRYLCAAAHLRRSMLPAEIDDPDTSGRRPPQPVGRVYARRVLFERHGLIPMPGVDLKELRRHCYAAFRQTLIRDGAVLAALGTAAFLAPAGTAFLLGLVAIVARFRSPLVLVSATLLVIALIFSRTAGSIRLLPPLLAIGACFLFFTADNLWARQRVRHLLRERAKDPADTTDHDDDAGQNGHDHHNGDRGLILTTFNREFKDGLNGRARNLVSMPELSPIKVFYEKDRIVGTGTPLIRSALTVAVDKPADDDEPITPFTSNDLLKYILAHLRAQGMVNQDANGFAYRMVLVGDKWQALDMPAPDANGNANGRGRHFTEFESFTHGLPDLGVGEVIAVPVPRVKVVPVWWFFVRYVTPQLLGHRRADQTQLSDLEFRSFIKQPPTADPERHYVRASATTWDGQVVISIYASAVLQAHYLRVLVRPYVLAPVGPELKHASELAQKNFAVQAGGAIRSTARQMMFMADWLHKMGRRKRDRRENGNTRSKPKPPGLSSARESYALAYTDNLHHTEDAERMIQVMELKIFKVTREYLKDHNVDLEDYDNQVQVYINSTVVGNIKDISGNLAIGDNNNQQQQQGNRQQQGPPDEKSKGRNGSK